MFYHEGSKAVWDYFFKMNILMCLCFKKVDHFFKSETILKFYEQFFVGLFKNYTKNKLLYQILDQGFFQALLRTVIWW